MTHDEMIAVIAAHRDGKKIEQKLIGEGGIKWRPMENKGFMCDCFEYRIAPSPPKPREWWIVLDSQDKIVGGMTFKEGAPIGPVIHVREVLPSPKSREWVIPESVLLDHKLNIHGIHVIEVLPSTGEEKPDIPPPAQSPPSGIRPTGGASI